LRNFFSIISAAALFGVALGVAILIVVMSVMDGFEIEVKKRLLAFSPHISLRHAPEGAYEPITNWHEVSDSLKNFPEITEVAGTIDDNAIIEHMESQLPISYRGIDTQDAAQVAALQKLLTDEYGTSSAEMGVESKALILESRARQFGIQVGDVVQLYSTRNFDEVFDAYKRTERPRASEEFASELQQAVENLKQSRLAGKTPETFLLTDLQRTYDILLQIQEAGVRPGESDTIDTVLDILYDAEKVNETQRRLDKGATQHIERLLLVHLSELDNTLDDNAELKKLKSIVLPKDVQIVGVYRISQQVVAPDFFLPLPVAQELSGLDEGVHALSIRLRDVDEAENVSERIVRSFDYGWYASSWMQRYSDFFKVVEMQEAMMALVLSTVAVGAAFLITIVMFLTALQKKKEIGVMLAVGAKPRQICSIFFLQGVIIGFIGIALGVVLGLTILHFRVEIQGFLLSVFNLDIFNAQFQGMESLPAHTTPSLVAWVCVLALVMCSLAPLLPALFAARNAPAKSLRDL